MRRGGQTKRLICMPSLMLCCALARGLFGPLSFRQIQTSIHQREYAHCVCAHIDICVCYICALFICIPPAYPCYLLRASVDEINTCMRRWRWRRRRSRLPALSLPARASFLTQAPRGTPTKPSTSNNKKTHGPYIAIARARGLLPGGSRQHKPHARTRHRT